MAAEPAGDSSSLAAATARSGSRTPLSLGWPDVLALLAVMGWGMHFPVVKILLNYLDPLPMVFLRGLFATLMFVGILAVTRDWRLPRREDLRLLVVVSLVGSTLNAFFFSAGLKLTTASHSGLIFALVPLLVFAISHLLGHLRISSRDLLG